MGELPNLLTLLRLPLAAGLWIAYESAVYVLAVAAVAALSDMLDGWFARRMRQRAEQRGVPAGELQDSRALGAWLDPACDKTFVASLLVVTYVSSQATWWWMLAIGARDVIQALLVAVYYGIPGLKSRVAIDFSAGMVGKATTVAQFLTVAALLLDLPGAQALVFVSLALGLASVAYYSRRTWQRTRQARQQSKHPGREVEFGRKHGEPQFPEEPQSPEEPQ